MMADGLREDGEEAQADERDAEDREADVLDEGREGRIGDESPVEMAGIAEELEFVAMEAVAAVGEHVEQGDGGGEGEEEWPLGFGRRSAGAIDSDCELKTRQPLLRLSALRC